jgi:hypothetical protein
MKIKIVPRSLCLSVLGFAALSVAHAEAPATPAPPKLTAVPKVRVFVRENSVATSVGSTATPTPPTVAGKGAKTAQVNAAQQAINELDAEKFTRTSKKTLTVTLANLADAPMNVTIKSTFLGKDEGGKHDVVEEKTLEKSMTLQPGRPDEFTTEEVSFAHTAAHHAPVKKAGGGGAGAGMTRGVSPMVPASGHAYFGYRVEVFQGQELVGLAVSETH